MKNKMPEKAKYLKNYKLLKFPEGPERLDIKSIETTQKLRIEICV